MALATEGGSFMEPLGLRNNNPLNIKFSAMNKWQGQTGENKTFCVFKEQKYGFRAAAIILKKYFKRGANTISRIIDIWSPDPMPIRVNYKRYVAEQSDINMDRVLRYDDRDSICAVMRAMAMFECGRHYIDMKEVRQGYEMAEKA